MCCCIPGAFCTGPGTMVDLHVQALLKVSLTYQISSLLTLIKHHAHENMARNLAHILMNSGKFSVRNWWSCSHLLILTKCRLCCHPLRTHCWKCGLSLLSNDCFWHCWITVIMRWLLSSLIAVVEQLQYYPTCITKYENIAHDLTLTDSIKTLNIILLFTMGVSYCILYLILGKGKLNWVEKL